MKIDIINNEGEKIIVHIEKHYRSYIMEFCFESDAIAFCENVLNITDYRVARYPKIGKADL